MNSFAIASNSRSTEFEASWSSELLECAGLCAAAAPSSSTGPSGEAAGAAVDLDLGAEPLGVAEAGGWADGPIPGAVEPCGVDPPVGASAATASGVFLATGVTRCSCGVVFSLSFLLGLSLSLALDEEPPIESRRRQPRRGGGGGGRQRACPSAARPGLCRLGGRSDVYCGAQGRAHLGTSAEGMYESQLLAQLANRAPAASKRVQGTQDTGETLKIPRRPSTLATC